MNLPYKLIQLNDKKVVEALKNQVDHPGSRYNGGIMDAVRCIPSPTHHGTPAYMASMATALVTPRSKFYQDERTLEALNQTAEYMLGLQHEDGTISLGSTNFHSPPDTAFIVSGFVHIYILLSDCPWKSVSAVAEKIKVFLARTIPALLTGGCHTPNHRWVMTAALGALYQLFPEKELIKRAEEWLAEGIDMTEDGEWTERSNGIYNVVSDMNIFYISKYLNRPHLLNYIRKNLDMMLYMVHPNGDIVTEYSVRQDVGEKCNLSGYYLPYRLMADHDRDKVFAAMSDFALEHMNELGSVNDHALLTLLIFPTHIENLERGSLPVRYTKVFNKNHPVKGDLKKMEEVGHHSKILHSKLHTEFGAPIVRYRNDKTSMTTMTHHPLFFSLRHGEVNLLGMSIHTAFTPGIVALEQFEMTSKGYSMKTTMEKGYNGPIRSEDIPRTSHADISPWYLLPHQLRPLTHVQKHQIEVEMSQTENNINLQMRSNDHIDVMTQILFLFGADHSIRGVDQIPGQDHAYFWKHGQMHISAGKDWIEISEGQQDHKVQPASNLLHHHGIQVVVVNLYTPFEKNFNIKLSE